MRRPSRPAKDVAVENNKTHHTKGKYYRETSRKKMETSITRCVEFNVIKHGQTIADRKNTDYISMLREGL